MMQGTIIAASRNETTDGHWLQDSGIFLRKAAVQGDHTLCTIHAGASFRPFGTQSPETCPERLLRGAGQVCSTALTPCDITMAPEIDKTKGAALIEQRQVRDVEGKGGANSSASSQHLADGLVPSPQPSTGHGDPPD